MKYISGEDKLVQNTFSRSNAFERQHRPRENFSRERFSVHETSSTSFRPPTSDKSARRSAGNACNCDVSNADSAEWFLWRRISS